MTMYDGGRQATPGNDPWCNTRVVKTMWPPSPGTKKLRRRFGDSLVCVRYRRDAAGRHRYTTVELVVDHAPLRVHVARTTADSFVVVTLRDWNDPLHALIAQSGGHWNRSTRTWQLPKGTALHLHLLRSPKPPKASK